MATTATLESAARQLVPAQDTAVSVVVRNDSEIVEEYLLEVVGQPAAWATAEPAQAHLYPGQTATITLHFRPPRASAVLAGFYPYGVKVLPTDRPEDAVVLEGAVELLSFVETTAELVPRTSHGRFGSRYRIAVDNRGNTPITVALHGADRGDMLSFHFRQRERTIAPGTAEFASLRVRPASLILRGVPATHPFTVTITPPEDEEHVPARARDAVAPLREGFTPVTLQGTYVQKAVLPRWFAKALVTVAILVPAFIALWFSVLEDALGGTARREELEPPTTESTAPGHHDRDHPMELTHIHLPAGQPAADAVRRAA